MRVIFTLFTLFCIIVAPYWIYLPLIALGIILLPLYVEAIALALLADMLYGTVHASLVASVPFGMIAALLVFLAQPLREYIRFNA